MVSLMLLSMIGSIGCSQEGDSPKMPLPAYPLCFVENDPNKHILDRIGHTTPAPVRAIALLIPYFMAPGQAAVHRLPIRLQAR